MCTDRNIEDVLKQLENCDDTTHMRRLLEEANACHECPEALRTSGEKEPDCRCRRRFRVEMQNIIEFIRHENKIVALTYDWLKGNRE